MEVEIVSQRIRHLSLQGTTRKWINESKTSRTSRRRRMICSYCDGDHKSTECILEISVPQGAYVNAFHIITCGICGLKIENDLRCPGCKDVVPGRIFPNICGACGVVCIDHNSDSCPNKGKPIPVGDYPPVSPDWAPSSPPYY